MKFDLQKAKSEVQAELDASINPEVRLPGLYWHAFTTAKLAKAGLPKRDLSPAYVLGVLAGTEFDVHGTIPQSPFKATSTAGIEYVEGIKDALLIDAERERLTPTLGDVFGLIFGGGK